MKNCEHPQVLGRRASAILLVVGLAISLSSCSESVDSPTSERICQDISIGVSMTTGQEKAQNVYAQLCEPPSKHTSTIQVLVHGITYDHVFWDFPGFGGRYSYVEAMNSAGYSTLAIDRIGNGLSSHPPSVAIQVYSDAWVLHQVIQAVRNGEVDGQPWDVVLLVGHSYGTVVAELEIAKYQDADGLIATGALWHPNFLQYGSLIPNSYPASLDPKFSGSGLDPGYLTTRPGTRDIFYQGGSYDPAVLAKDEQLKQLFTVTEMSTSALPELALVYSKIKVPTLLVIGDHDAFYCTPLAFADCSSSDAVLADQQALFPAEAQLRAYVQPDSGHDINLTTNNIAGFAAEKTWLAEFFPI